MSDRPAHTALPWGLRYRGNQLAIVGDAGEWLAVLPHAPSDGFGLMALAEIHANAALIVRAVNSHDELVKALEAILAKHKGLFGDPPHELAGCDLQDIDRAYAILARAREQP